MENNETKKSLEYLTTRLKKFHSKLSASEIFEIEFIIERSSSVDEAVSKLKRMANKSAANKSLVDFYYSLNIDLNEKEKIIYLNNLRVKLKKQSTLWKYMQLMTLLPLVVWVIFSTGFYPDFFGFAGMYHKDCFYLEYFYALHLLFVAFVAFVIFRNLYSLLIDFRKKGLLLFSLVCGQLLMIYLLNLSYSFMNITCIF